MMAAMMLAVISASAQGRFEPGTLTLQPRIGGTAAQMTNMPKFQTSKLGYDGDVDATVTGGGLVGLELEYQLTDRLSFAAGAMIYVVVEELVPEMAEGEHSNWGTIAFMMGFVLMMILDVALG